MIHASSSGDTPYTDSGLDCLVDKNLDQVHEALTKTKTDGSPAFVDKRIEELYPPAVDFINSVVKVMHGRETPEVREAVSRGFHFARTVDLAVGDPAPIRKYVRPVVGQDEDLAIAYNRIVDITAVYLHDRHALSELLYDHMDNVAPRSRYDHLAEVMVALTAMNIDQARRERVQERVNETFQGIRRHNA